MNRLRKIIRKEMQAILSENAESSTMARTISKRLGAQFIPMTKMEIEDILRRYPEVTPGRYVAGAYYTVENTDAKGMILCTSSGKCVALLTEANRIIQEYPATSLQDAINWMQNYYVF